MIFLFTMLSLASLIILLAASVVLFLDPTATMGQKNQAAAMLLPASAATMIFAIIAIILALLG